MLHSSNIEKEEAGGGGYLIKVRNGAILYELSQVLKESLLTMILCGAKLDFRII